MREWDENSEEVRKVRPDKEMARSILKMVKLRLEYLEHVDSDKYTSLLVEGYYEVVKESITALMAIRGYKTLSHEILVGYLKYYKEFSEFEVRFIDQTRILRNNITYKGFFVKKEYWKRNKATILSIVSKLVKVLEKELGD
ncbi:MAG: hypothetical protein V1818_04095 [Candidatus Aenigmatarchaeota archaeon]